MKTEIFIYTRLKFLTKYRIFFIIIILFNMTFLLYKYIYIYTRSNRTATLFKMNQAAKTSEPLWPDWTKRQ